MKTTLFMLMLLVPLASHAGEGDQLKVVTSVETFADLARRVGGDKVQVESLSKGYQDPHFVDARPNLMVLLNKADLLVRVGLDLEIGWLPLLVQGSRNERINPGQPGDFDASTTIEVKDAPLGKVTRELGDIHPMGNPHYWLTPVNVVRVAKGLTERLKQLRPADAAYFDARFAAFVTELKAHAVKWDEQAKALAGLKVVTYHKSWVYLTGWLKLEEVGYVENKPGVPPSPDHLAKLIVQMKAQGVKALLVEDFYNQSIARTVAEQSGAKLLSMPSAVGGTPAIKSVFDLFDAQLSLLSSVK